MINKANYTFLAFCKFLPPPLLRRNL